MPVNIGTTANIDQARLKQETSHPSSPASGYELLYIISGSPHGGMYLKDSAGNQIGPFITGSVPGWSVLGEVFPSGTNTIQVNSSPIPATYRKLILDFSGRSTASSDFDYLEMKLNNDTTAVNYRYVLAYVYLAGTYGGEGGDTFKIGVVAAANSPANSVGRGSIEIPYYADANNKEVFSDGTARRDVASIHEFRFWGGFEWENTAAVTRVDISLTSGNFVNGFRAVLYGVP